VGKDDIDNAFKGRNYGVGCKGGVEVIALAARRPQQAQGLELGAPQDRLQERLQQDPARSFCASSVQDVPSYDGMDQVVLRRGNHTAVRSPMGDRVIVRHATGRPTGAPVFLLRHQRPRERDQSPQQVVHGRRRHRGRRGAAA